MRRFDASAAALALALVASACGGDDESAARAEPAEEAGLFAADTASVSLPLTLPGQLYVELDAHVYARTTGIAESVFVDLGSEVRQGERLAQLENVDQRIAVERAEVAHENARRELERSRTLAQARLVAQADSERAEVEFRRADLALQQARRDMQLTRITAPFAGVVAARMLRPGRLVSPGDSLFRVTALTPLRVAVRVPEAQARGLGVGAVGFVLALDGSASRAPVIRAAPGVDAASGTRELVLELADASRMRPGQSVTVRLGAEHRIVVAVPAAAVADSGYVLVWAGGRTSLRSVVIGSILPDGRVEVVSGLAAGERVARPGP